MLAGGRLDGGLQRMVAGRPAVVATSVGWTVKSMDKSERKKKRTSMGQHVNWVV